MVVERTKDRVVPRSADMAGGHVFGGKVLSVYGEISTRRDVFVDISNSSICDVDSCKCSRGTWPREHPNLHPVPPHRPGFVERARNPSPVGPAGWHCNRGTHHTSDGWVPRRGQDDPRAHPSPSEAWRKAVSGCDSRYSLFAIRYSRLVFA